MALRQKTLISSGEREQSQAMMEAGRVGVGQRLQAGQALAEQTTRTGEIALQGGQALGARLSEYERQKIEESRLSQARDIAKGQEMAQNRQMELAEAERGYERAPGGPDSPLMQEERERRVREGMDRGTSPEGAGAAPGGPAAALDVAPGQQPGAAPGLETALPQGPEVSPRPPGEAQRLQAQGQHPIEIGAGRPAAPGYQEPGALRLSETGRRREDRADYEAQTRRIEAMGRMAAQQDTAMKAEFAGNEEVYDDLKKQMDGEIGHLSDVFSRFKTGRTERNDFKELRKWAEQMGMQDNQADGGRLMQIIDDAAKSGRAPTTGEASDRIQGFMQGYMNRRAYEYTLVLGQTPGDFIDEASPMKQAFGSASMEFTAIMQGLGPLAQQSWGITSYRDKIRMQNRWAAAQVLAGRTAAPGGGAFGLPQVTPPGAGFSGEPQAQQQPREDLRPQLEAHEEEQAARESEQAARESAPRHQRNWDWAKNLPK